MNILMVAQGWFPDTIGGAGRYAADLAAGLSARGHRVTVFTQRAVGTPADEAQDGVRVFRYGPLRHWWQVPGSLWAVRRLFHRLHRERPFDLLSIHHALPAWPLLTVRQAARLPWVYHFQSPWAQEFEVQRAAHRLHPATRLGLWARQTIEHLVLRQARACVTLSEFMKANLAATHGVPAGRVQVIPGCVNLRRFHPAADRGMIRAQLGLSPDRRVLMTARLLVPRQNLDGLIQAMRPILDARPETLLVIAGSGPLRQPLEALIRSLSLQANVRLLGPLPDERLPLWYQAADLFIMPSKALEGFGLATLEALACGTPAIGTPIGGTTELLGWLDASLLCESPQPQAIASTALRVLDRIRDPQAARDLSSRCRAFAVQFSLEATAERIERVYQAAAPLSVLHVHTLPVISGSGLNVLEAMRGQQEAGYDVELACAPGGPLVERAEAQGVAVRRVAHLVWPIHPVQDLLAVWELWRLMRRQRYTVVHTHNSKAGFVGRLAARLAGVPVVIHTVHGFAFHSQERRWRRWLYRMLERLAARWCDGLILISQPLVEWALRERIAPAEKMTKIYSGIDLSAFRRPVDVAALREAFGFRNQEFVVGEVAKLWAGKGHEVLLRAAATLTDRIPSLRLFIVGEGGLHPALVRLAQELGLGDRVVFAGFRTDVPAVTHLLDVAVLPSLFEGMGRAILEAQAAGKPVIASRVGGIPDLVAHERTGLLVEPGNAQELAEAIWRLYADPDLRRTLGEAARQALDSRFTVSTMVEQILRLYDERLAGKRGATRRLQRAGEPS